MAGIQVEQVAGPGAPGRRELVSFELIVLVVSVLLAGLLFRVWQIQSSMSGMLEERAIRQQRMVIPLPARRGKITDSAGRVLAGTVERPSVFVDPKVVGDDLGRVAASLSEILEIPAAQIREQIAARAESRFVWVVRRTSVEKGQAVRSARLPGVGVVGEAQRVYPLGSLAAHVLGHCGIDDVGMEGLEKRFNAQLAGQAGYQEVLCDAGRRPLEHMADRFSPPRDGYHLVLTIDAVIQASAERHLRAAVEDFEARSGVAIVMDPRSGEVLALANWPTYDPNRAGQSTAESRRNRAITDPYEPGSIFKTVIAAAAVDMGLARLDEMIHCENGVWVLGRRRLRDVHPYGLLSMRDVVVKSSNIGMAKIGMRMGNPRLYAALERFGFTARTGIELPGEDRGLVSPLSRWKSYTTPSVSMGHEMAVTPLQMLTAFCAILNDGQLLAPRIVRGVFDSDGERIIEDRSRPIPVRRALEAPTARRFTQDVMAAVVNEGTGKRAQLALHQVVGKTGTAQIPFFGRAGYEPGAYIGSFLGAVPAENPQVAVLVSVVRPKVGKGYYGGTVAAPAAKLIMADVISYWNIPPSPGMEPGAAVGGLGACGTVRR